MQVSGHIAKFDGQHLVVDLNNLCDWQIQALKKLPAVEITANSNLEITIDQRKKVFAMLHDISEYTGYTILESEQLMKIRYLSMQANPQYFSLSDCSRELATDFIKFLINFCLTENISFTTRVMDEIQQDYHLRVRLLKKRLCYVCGKPNSDIDHVDTIGSGRNRRHLNQVGMRAWCLCRKHHSMRHTIGVMSMAKKYKIKPVKLTPNLINYLDLSDKGATK